MKHCRTSRIVPKTLFYTLTSWLIAVTLEYLIIPKEVRPLSVLSGISLMSETRIISITVLLFVIMNLVLGHFPIKNVERWLIVDAFALYATSAVINSFSWAFLVACVLVMIILLFYARYGWDHSAPGLVPAWEEKIIWNILTATAALVFFCLVSAWTIARVHSFSTPSFDCGIFSQMFYYMKTTGLQMTTLERDGLLSHFAVHVSPIYYLMLPFYWLVPRPETLQVLQAAILSSSVIPLWKLGKHHRLHPGLRTLICILLLLYPAYAGGSSYDLHENCFLTPLILWLLYGIEQKKISVISISAVLTLMVKEDAPVYVAIIALYSLLHSLLYKDKWGVFSSFALIVSSIAWFLTVTAYLSKCGEGIMTYRYKNYMYDGSNSLFTVVKAVLLCPIKTIFECVNAEKLKYIGFTIIPLFGLPLITRRYERFILLIPYLLVNLMSDYQYQHNILFQYNFGSAACLFYLVVLNLVDIKAEWKRISLVSVALCISFSCFYEEILPIAKQYIFYCTKYTEYYDNQRTLLNTIPDDSSVAATTFYTTYLSNRLQLYDVRYSSVEHILGCEYVVINVNESASFEIYELDGANGKENFVTMLLDNGYHLESKLNNVLEIYKKHMSVYTGSSQKKNLMLIDCYEMTFVK